MSTQVNISKKITVKDEAILLTSDVNSINFTGTGITATTVGNDVTVTVPGSGLTVGTTAIASGTDGRVLFQDAGVLQQDASFFWDNTNKRLGVGATPSTAVRLDVRAQGALSTDIAFRVRNSANTVSMSEFLGNGDFWLRNSAGTASLAWTGTGLNLNSSGTVIGNLLGNINISPSTFVQLSTGGGNFGLRASGNISFGGSPEDGSGSKCIIFNNGTAPSTNLTDKYYQYSADIVAGNAAPHFRTENGNVIKIYRETTAVAAAAFVANTSLIANDSATYGGYTMGQVVAALKAQGLLA